jgi:hypothetical protein
MSPVNIVRPICLSIDLWPYALWTALSDSCLMPIFTAMRSHPVCIHLHFSCPDEPMSQARATPLGGLEALSFSMFRMLTTRSAEKYCGAPSALASLVHVSVVRGNIIAVILSAYTVFPSPQLSYDASSIAGYHFSCTVICQLDFMRRVLTWSGTMHPPPYVQAHMPSVT